MTEIIKSKLLTRRDTAANWASVSPILEEGEFAYETDTKKMKIGNGTSRYNDLPYFQTGGMTSVEWDDILNKPTFSRVAESGSYLDLVNTPIIGNGKITVMQGGVEKAIFSVNQEEDIIIELEAGGQGGGTAWTLGNGLVVDPAGRLTTSLNPRDLRFNNAGQMELVQPNETKFNIAVHKLGDPDYDHDTALTVYEDVAENHNNIYNRYLIYNDDGTGNNYTEWGVVEMSNKKYDDDRVITLKIWNGQEIIIKYNDDDKETAQITCNIR